MGTRDTPPNWALTHPESALAVTAPAETWRPSSRCAAAKRASRSRALQVLLYPVLDLSAKTRSRTLFSDGFFLSKLQEELVRRPVPGRHGHCSRRCTGIAAEGR